MAQNIHDLQDFLDNFKERYIEEIQNRVMLAAVIATKGEYIQRIFTRGEASDGNKIGTYKVYEAYYGKTDFVRTGAFQKRGKNSSGDFKNGKERKTMFFKDGWGGLREAQSRQKDFKNYKVTGSLEKSIQVVTMGERKSIVLAITDGQESEKRKGLEAQDGKPVFNASAGDMKVFIDAVGDEVQHLLQTL